MHTNLGRATLITAGSLLLAGTVLLGDSIRFSDFTPLSSSAGPTADENLPLTLGNPAFRQESIANRHAQLAALKPNCYCLPAMRRAGT